MAVRRLQKQSPSARRGVDVSYLYHDDDDDYYKCDNDDDDNDNDDDDFSDNLHHKRLKSPSAPRGVDV